MESIGTVAAVAGSGRREATASTGCAIAVAMLCQLPASEGEFGLRRMPFELGPPALGLFDDDLPADRRLSVRLNGKRPVDREADDLDRLPRENNFRRRRRPPSRRRRALARGPQCGDPPASPARKRYPPDIGTLRFQPPGCAARARGDRCARSARLAPCGPGSNVVVAATDMMADQRSALARPGPF